jgi:hypothetical protein
MKRYCCFFRFWLILTIFSLLTPTSPVAFANTHEVIPLPISSSREWDYDAVIQFIEEIEEGNIEDHYRKEDIDRICHFVAFLAKEGAMPSEIEGIEDDLEDLLLASPYLYETALYKSTIIY